MPLDLLVVFIAISVLILIHEVGHFLAARFFHIWVEEFGLGLPPKIWGRKIGETVYSINLLPMGGFVKLHGEEQPASSKISKPGRAFFKRPWWQRSIILTAGVLMNFVFATAVISYIFTKGVPVPDRVEIKEVAQNSPAEAAGIKPGDLLIKIDNIDVTEITEVTKLISLRLDRETALEFLRITDDKKEEKVIVKAVPRKKPPPGEGALGVVLQQQLVIRRYPFYSAPYHGLKSTINMSWVLLRAISGVFWDFISGFKVPKDVAGPIGMYQLYGEARKDGLTAILELTGLISLNLAVVNLFPIPPLDGARLFFVLIERISGKRLRKEWEEKMYQVSFLFLIALFILISIQDVRRLLGF